jgi:hypothetical protein
MSHNYYIRLGLRQGWGGGESPFYISEEGLRRHIYAVGKTGTGKTNLLKTIFLRLVESGQGVALLDPHGDLAEELLDLLPRSVANAHGYERLTRDLDLVIGLERDNVLCGLRALLATGYIPSIPATPEDFADKATRDTWRREKNMLVLKLWSDAHRRTPLDVFVYEPFDFDKEYAKAERMEVAPGLAAPFVTLDTLLIMKREAARPQDVMDIAVLEELRRTGEDEIDDQS